MTSNDDDVCDRFAVTDAASGIVPAAQVDQIQPDQNEVQVGELCLQIVNVPMPPNRNHSRRIKFLSQVKDNHVQ